MKFRLIILVLASIFIVSCSESTDPFMEMEEEQSSVDPIDVITRLSIEQTLEGPNTFQLVISNEEPIDCLEELIANLSEGADSKILEIDYVNDPGCSNGMEYLTKTIVPELDVAGSSLEISIEGIINKAKMSLDEDRFQIKFETMDKLVIDRLIMDRIPEDIAWGYANLSNTECRDIRASYHQLVGIPEDLILAKDFPEGNYYGYFEIGDLNSVVGMDGQENSGQAMILDLAKDNSWQLLSDLLLGMKQSCPNLEYYFQNAEGEIIQS